MRLSVREYGTRRAAHTVVLLHGCSLNKDSWNIQITELLRQWNSDIRIIAYDHRGHGKSAGAPMHTYRIERLGADLGDVLTSLHVKPRLTLVGHSMGGMASLAYLGLPASLRPVDPHGLVLVATAAGQLTERGLGRLLATPAIDILYLLAQHVPHSIAEGAFRLLTRPLCGALVSQWGYGTRRHDALAAISAAAINATPLATKAAALHALRHYDQYRTLKSVTATTVVLSGGADLLTPPSHARDIAAGIAGAIRIHEPQAGHMLLHEALQLVATAINHVLHRGKLAYSSPIGNAAYTVDSGNG
ncbi:hypothetical protein BST20_18220 [Mycobacterium branderi]|uniref:AB hydrolase-1 domain-containing protein n=1 Tax=Mycobacterium branderi TaxID=43348 RepID=A0AA91RHA2_9MYCO|nr:hypothetical protein BST20_18220 [Mycobacterium branderi]